MGHENEVKLGEGSRAMCSQTAVSVCKARRVLRNVACAASAALALAGGLGEATASIVNWNAVVQDDIEYYMQTDKAVYSLGEDVELLYRVTNLGNEDVEIFFPNLQQYTFQVTDEEGIAWHWPKGFWPTISYLRLQPGDSKEYHESWDMIDDNWSLVSPGAYEVSGMLDHFLPEDQDWQVPVSVSIQIIPEPSLLALAALGALAALLRKRR